MPRAALKVYAIHVHKGSHSCLGGVTYALGANDRGVTGAWESLVPLTPERSCPLKHERLAALLKKCVVSSSS